MATHSSVLAWRIPGTGEPGGLPSLGSHRVGHDWSDLAAAAAAIHSEIEYSLSFKLNSSIPIGRNELFLLAKEYKRIYLEIKWWQRPILFETCRFCKASLLEWCPIAVNEIWNWWNQNEERPNKAPCWNCSLCWMFSIWMSLILLFWNCAT